VGAWAKHTPAARIASVASPTARHATSRATALISDLVIDQSPLGGNGNSKIIPDLVDCAQFRAVELCGISDGFF
jgi:hypothetical protein